VWVIVPPEPVKAAAAALQRSFAHLDWIVPTPPHFLHVTVGHDGNGEPTAVEPFDLTFGPVNCFHEAVIAEVAGEGYGALAAGLVHEGPHLPHLTIGYVREPGPPAPLREALLPCRDADLGSQRVDEVQLVRVPASRTTVLRPWTVLRRLALRR
jgi:2'-5' RNA ligase